MIERSKWKFGVASVKRDGILYGLGYTREELKRPYIAVVNSWNEYNPGHVHLREIAERVKQGIRDAGGLPFEVTTTGLCDGMVLKDPRYIELPSRNLIADEVELNVEANMFDGMVLLSTCDSIVPGHLMACARLDIPAVVVTGGYMPHCFWRGEDIGLVKVSSTVGQVMEGKYPREDFDDMVYCAHMGCGACGSSCRGGGGGISGAVLGAADVVEGPDIQILRELLQLRGDLRGGQGGRGSREGAEGGDQVQAFTQANIDRLHAAHGQACHGTVPARGGGVILQASAPGAVMFVNIRDQIIAQLLAENVEGTHAVPGGILVICGGTAVGQDDDQVLHIALGKGAVRDILAGERAGHIGEVPFVFRTADAVAEEQHVTGDVF